MSDNIILQTQQLVKEFKGFVAVNGVSLQVRRGDIHALIGPNGAGKSTLLNRLVGQHLAITSPKPQSTRDRVVGIISDDDSQIVLFDTPGLLEPRYDLQRAMHGAARKALDYAQQFCATQRNARKLDCAQLRKQSVNCLVL